MVDELNKPVAYVNVVLQKSDTTFKIWTTTDNDGVFRLEKPAHAKLLCIYYIGYLTIYKDVTHSNEFDYREKTLVAYLSASKTLNKYFGIKAGLRYEHTFVKGVSPHSDLDDVKIDYGVSSFQSFIWITNRAHHITLI